MSDLQKYIAKQMKDPEFRAYAEEMDLVVEIADAILDARLKRNMTQQELSKATGIGQKEISNLESCKTKNPSIKTLKRIADGLNMDLNISFIPREDIE